MPPPKPAAAVPLEFVRIVTAFSTVEVLLVTSVNVNAPPVVAPPVRVARVTLFVSRFSAFASFVPIVTADPVLLPPFKMSPVPEGVDHVPSPRQKVEALADVPLFKFVTGKFPVTPVVSGSPVAFVSTKAVGVPSAGVTSVGEVARTGEPDPVAVVQTGKAAAPPPTKISVVAPAASV